MNLPSKVEIEAQRLSRSLSYYVQEAWKVVEPVTPFKYNWHIGLISEYLVALTMLQIQNLIINIPPRHMKSLQTMVIWPTWVWIDEPTSRWITGSYSLKLAIRDTLKSRRIIQSDWYQMHFGDRWQLTGDQNEKSRYENNKTGLRMAFGMDSQLTGEGGDFIGVDDSLKAQDADSDAEREKVNEVWDGSISTRANDPKKARRFIIGQRLHDDDLPGHVLERMKEKADAHQYELLCLPGRYEPKRFFSGIGLDDPRKTPGELLWPEHINEQELAAIEADLVERGTAGQIQQSPSPAGGAIFQRKWFAEGRNRYDATDSRFFNRNVARWLSFDTAFEDTQSADTTGMNVHELTPDYRLALREADWKKMQYPQLVQEVIDQAVRWNYDGKLRGIIIENKGSGISLIQTLRQTAEPWIAALILEFNPGTQSKPSRGRTASSWCSKDCVLLPSPSEKVPWLYDFEEMLFKFPSAKIDDPIDAFNQTILHLVNLIAEGWKLRTGITKKKRK